MSTFNNSKTFVEMARKLPYIPTELQEIRMNKLKLVALENQKQVHSLLDFCRRKPSKPARRILARTIVATLPTVKKSKPFHHKKTQAELWQGIKQKLWQAMDTNY